MTELGSEAGELASSPRSLRKFLNAESQGGGGDDDGGVDGNASL